MTREEACLKIHQAARNELGVKETPGVEATPRIIQYHAETTLAAKSDEISWCSSSANFIVKEAGFKGTRSAAARSWLKWGVPLEAPILGCVVIFDRKDDSNPNAAHVAFCDHPDVSNGIIRVAGGNQSNSFSIARFPTSKVLGYRSPV